MPFDVVELRERGGGRQSTAGVPLAQGSSTEDASALGAGSSDPPPTGIRGRNATGRRDDVRDDSGSSPVCPEHLLKEARGHDIEVRPRRNAAGETGRAT